MVKKLVSQTSFAATAGVSRQAIAKIKKTVLKKAFFGASIDLEHPDAIAYLKSKKNTETESPAEAIDPYYERALQKIRDGTLKCTAEAISSEYKIRRGRGKIIRDMVKAAGPIPKNKKEVKKKKPPPEEKRTEPKEREEYSELPGMEELPTELVMRIMDWPLRKILDTYGTDERFKKWLDSRKVMEDIRYKNYQVGERSGSLIPRKLVKEKIFGIIETSNIRLLTDAPRTLALRLGAAAKAGVTDAELEKVAREIMESQISHIKAQATRVLKNA